MTAEVSGPTDLFGFPLQDARETRGRKAHAPSQDMAEKIGILRATGRTVEEVAQLVGLSEPTLRKYYFRVLEQGAELVEAALDRKLFEQAMTGKGSVPANRALRERLAKGKAAIPIAPSVAPGRTAKAPKLGKKEQAQVDAHVAHEGTGWAGLLAPANTKPN